MRVLITGGAGFIGSHLADLFVSRGHEVTVVDDLSTGSIRNLEAHLSRPEFRFVHANILDEGVVHGLVASADQVFHLAAAVGVKLICERPLDSMRRNVRATEMVLDACLDYQKKVYIASTSEVYGKQTNIPFREESDLVIGPSSKLRWSYAASKLVDEFHAISCFREARLPVVVGRHFNTVGPRQSAAYGMVIPRFVRQALRGEPLTVHGDGAQSRTFTHVGEVVEIMARLMSDCPRAEGEVFNIAGTEEITIHELAVKIIAKTKSSSEIQIVPYAQVYNADFEDMRRRVPSVDKLRKFIGAAPEILLDEILDDVIRFESQPA